MEADFASVWSRVTGERPTEDAQAKLRRWIQDESEAVWAYQCMLRARVPSQARETIAVLLKEENRDLQTRNIRLQLSAVPEGQTGNLFRFTDPLPNIAQRNFVNGLCEKTSGFAGVFAGSDSDGYVFIIGARGKDARQAASLLREKLSARGGGKPEMVTGSVHASEKEIREALSALS